MFKDKLKQLREKEGLSQQDLADIVFVSRSAIAKWENGNGLPSKVNLQAICDHFNVDEESLIDRNELKETIELVYDKQKNIKIIFFASIASLLMFCLLVGGNYWLHRVAILFTIVYLVFKLFVTNNKVNKIICIVCAVLSILISIANWIVTAIPEPSSFLRIVTRLIMNDTINVNALNITLSQLSSIINIMFLVSVNVLLLVLNKNSKNLGKIKVIAIIIFILSLLCVEGIILFHNEKTLTHNQVKTRFRQYNDQYALNLPKSFDIIYTFRETSIDSYEYLMVVSPKDNYSLEYKTQCESSIHDDFDILEHFYNASDRTKELDMIAHTLSVDYDWYAYEEDKGPRTYNLFVVYDNFRNRLFVYYIVTQYTDCF